MDALRHFAKSRREFSRELFRRPDDRVFLEHFIGDVIAHLLPFALAGELDEVRELVLPTMHFQHRPVFRCRGVERDAFANSLAHRFETRFGLGASDETMVCKVDILQASPCTLGADLHVGQHHLAEPFVRHRFARNVAVGDLTGQPQHELVDGGDIDRDLGALDRPRVVVRDHQGEVVVVALVVELGAVLPAIPDGAHGFDVFTQARDRRAGLHTPPPRQVRLGLRPETELETPARQRLD